MLTRLFPDVPSQVVKDADGFCYRIIDTVEGELQDKIYGHLYAESTWRTNTQNFVTII